MDSLSNGQQGVNVNGSCSDRYKNIGDVPQGNVLGPLLFIVYKWLIPEVVQSNIAIFVDDTKLLIPPTIVVPYNLMLIRWWSGVGFSKWNLIL